jgi:hypothetical protein
MAAFVQDIDRSADGQSGRTFVIRRETRVSQVSRFR